MAYDLIIVGGGAVGLSTASHAAAQKLSTLVLEQFGFFNQEGSTAGASRQFRLQYSQQYMSEYALASVPYWKALQKHSPTELISSIGSLWFGSPSIDSQEGGISTAMKTMDTLGIHYQPLNANEIETRFPFKNLPQNYHGFFQKDGGIINVEATLSAMYNIASDSSYVELHDYETVRNIQSHANGNIDVITNKATYTSKKLVITAGAFTNEVLKSLNLHIDLNIWEMSSAYFRRTTTNIQYPTWFVFQEPQNTSLFYGFPHVDWTHPNHVRVAPDIPDRILIDPKKRTHTPCDHSLKLTDQWVDKHMTGLAPKAEFTSTCLIALANDNKEFLLDFAPSSLTNHKNIVVYTAGWSAKFIPILGDTIIKMITTGESQFNYGKYQFDQTRFSINWQQVKKETSCYFKQDYQDNQEMDVAIIGGGAAGLYSAYRLLNDSSTQKLKVNIFESSHRIGGRLESTQLPGMNVVGELGGMRYMSSQKIVSTLIEKIFARQYGLKPNDFQMGSPCNHLFYLRKQHFVAESFRAAKLAGKKFKTKYPLSSKFHGLSPSEIFNHIIANVLEKYGYHLADILAAEQPRKMWAEVKQKTRYLFDGPYQNLYLYEIGFWNLIKDQTDEACYEFLTDAGGYYSNTINWNAAEAFPYMVGDFSDKSIRYKTIDGGFDQIATCLADAVIKLNGEIRTQNQLVNFNVNTDKASKKRYQLQMYNHAKKQRYQVFADHIILALPKRALEKLDQNNFFFDELNNPKLHQDLNQIIPQPAYKILLGFESPWWINSLNAHYGESITDLPMRQCYYFGTDPENGHSLMLASYNDMRASTFWSALEQDAPYEGKATCFIEQKDLDGIQQTKATQTMVAELMKQLKELHGDVIGEIPTPYVAIYKDWSADPYGGGYHAWKPHCQTWKVMPAIRKAYEAHQVYISGEAYSDQQGWVEGALCVSEHILQTHFKLKAPDWLDPNYYLGY